VCFCDFIFSDRNAQFGFPEVTLGLIPGAGGTVLLKERVGVAKANEMIFSGQLINCRNAKYFGLVDFDCQHSNLVRKSKKFLLFLTKNPPDTITLAKKSIKSNSYQKEKNLFTQCIKSPHTKENIIRYLQKSHEGRYLPFLKISCHLFGPRQSHSQFSMYILLLFKR
jgi:enoyl-CoA hydratase/carnithine racemase